MDLRRRWSRRAIQLLYQGLCMREKTNARIGYEHLVIRSCKSDRHQPTQRNDSDKSKTRLVHFDDDRGRYTKSNNGEKLVGNAKERPERIDSPDWVVHSLPEEVSPGADNECAPGQNAGIPTGAAQRLPQMTHGFLQHEAGDARARIENVENQQCLKHDGKVIPDGGECFPTETVGEDMCHAHGKGRCTPGTVEKVLLTDGFGQRSHLRR